MSEHTPGPWTAYRLIGADGQPLRGETAVEYVTRCIRVGGEADYFAVVVGDGAETLDICHTGNGPTSGRNALLIAAAPELLIALRDLREAATEAYKSGRIAAEPFVRAGNVLAKAEGAIAEKGAE